MICYARISLLLLVQYLWIVKFGKDIIIIETWCFVLGWGFRLSLDFFVFALHTRTAVARLPLRDLRQLGFLVGYMLNGVHYCV